MRQSFTNQQLFDFVNGTGEAELGKKLSKKMKNDKHFNDAIINMKMVHAKLKSQYNKVTLSMMQNELQVHKDNLLSIITFLKNQ